MWLMCWEKILQLHLLSNMIICVDQRFAVKSFGCILSDLNLQLEQSQMENPAREKSAQVSKIWLSIFCYFHCWIFSLAVKVSDHWYCHAKWPSHCPIGCRRASETYGIQTHVNSYTTIWKLQLECQCLSDIAFIFNCFGCKQALVAIICNSCLRSFVSFDTLPGDCHLKWLPFSNKSEQTLISWTGCLLFCKRFDSEPVALFWYFVCTQRPMKDWKIEQNNSVALVCDICSFWIQKFSSSHKECKSLSMPKICKALKPLWS